MTDLRSAAVPSPLPDDHRRGPGAAPQVRGPGAATLVIEYADFECPHCAALHARLGPRLRDPAGLPVEWIFRHFPSRSAHPRAWPAACAAESAGLQGRFWEMHDLLLGDQGHLEDPHLWAHAQRLGLDVERFDADRRSEPVRARVQRDFQAGIRAGVATTPTVFVDGVAYRGEAIEAVLAKLIA